MNLWVDPGRIGSAGDSDRLFDASRRNRGVPSQKGLAFGEVFLNRLLGILLL